MLRAIEALGHSLGMSIVVEGVESFEEAAYLQAATRIDLAQGYYFARPVVFDALVVDTPSFDFVRPVLPVRSAEATRRLPVRRG